MPGINSSKLYWAMFQDTPDAEQWCVLMVGTLSQIGGRVRALDRLNKWLENGTVLPGDVPQHDYQFAKTKLGEIIVQPYDKEKLPEYFAKEFSKVPGLMFMGKRYDFEVEEV